MTHLAEIFVTVKSSDAICSITAIFINFLVLLTSALDYFQKNNLRIKHHIYFLLHDNNSFFDDTLIKLQYTNFTLFQVKKKQKCKLKKLSTIGKTQKLNSKLYDLPQDHIVALTTQYRIASPIHKVISNKLNDMREISKWRAHKTRTITTTTLHNNGSKTSGTTPWNIKAWIAGTKK